MAYVIGFSAWSGTGKTTLLEKVIGELKARGLRVAVVKHDVHGIDPCEEGKDSGRFRKAGADRVILIGPEAADMPGAAGRPKAADMPGAADGSEAVDMPGAAGRPDTADRPEAAAGSEARLWKALEALQGADIILVEGFKHAPIPRVGLCRMAADKPLPEPPDHYAAVVTDTDLAAAVPRFGWNEHRELTDFLIRLARAGMISEQAGAGRDDL